MTTQTRWILVDDLDGSTASTTVEFGLDHQTYAIDLSAENAARLRAVLDEFVAVAHLRHRAPAPVLRRSASTQATAVAPPARREPAAPMPHPGVELVEMVRDLYADVRRAGLELLLAVLETLRDRLAMAGPAK